MQVSVIIPTFNEANFIAEMIESLIDQDFPKEEWEVLIVDGKSEDGTRDIIRSYQENNSWIQLLDNPHRVVPHAMNIGVKESRGEFIVRMDAHSRYPRNYVRRLLEVLQESHAENVGGVWETIPGADTDIAMAIALASSHPFGIGNAAYRLENDELKEVDTVPYGCYPREVFDRIGLYDEDLVRNQDDELNGRLIAAGGRILLIPDMKIKYSARPTWKKMMKMFYQYGYFKPLVNKKLGRPATWRQFIPPAFVLVGAILIGSLFFTSSSFIQWLISLVYVVAALFIALILAIRERSITMFILVPITFFLIHLSYGCGYWTGVWRFLVLGGNSSPINSSR